MRILVTGSAGLIGGEAVEYFGTRGHAIVGIDNNMRREFFGPDGDTMWNLHRVAHHVPSYVHCQADVRDLEQVRNAFFMQGPFDVVIHCAAQPSHDKAREIPLIDHAVNVTGTHNLLAMTREYCPQAVFIFMSTNKVYGDAPNEIPMVELDTRYDYANEADREGVAESCRVDQSTHSVFGANKLAADIMVQEYARTYGLKTCVFRGGCLTGPGHSGVELHGFLSYLVKVGITGGTYKVYGYKGKQVRDNLHSYDVMRAMEEVIQNPRPGEVYNMGGGRANSVSVLEALARVEQLLGKPIAREYVEQNRLGDHVCYITDLRKFQAHYPNWRVTKSLDQTLGEMIQQDYWGRYSDHEDTYAYPLTSDSLVWDVGGYRGAWTARIVERYDPNVWIFEPVREFYEDCRRRFQDNPKVEIFNFGLGESDGTATIARQGQNSSAFRGGAGQVPLEPDRVYGAPVPETVAVRDIVAFHKEAGSPRVALISMNAEGAEYGIFRHLLNTGVIGCFDNVQVQFHPFYPDANRTREWIGQDLRLTHVKSFCYPFVWESWKRK